MYRQIIMLTALMCLLSTSAYATQVSVEPAYQEAFKGDNISIDITVDPETNGIYGASYTLYFNNTLLNAISQIKGPFLTLDGQSSNIYFNDINNTLGIIRYAESRMGTWDDVFEYGILSTITFEVIADEGTSLLSIGELDQQLLYSTTGPVQADINNGTVEIRKGICGDVDGQNGVTIGDGIQVAMSTIYGQEAYPLEIAWCADVDCENGITIGDGIQIAMSTIYGQEAYPLDCC